MKNENLKNKTANTAQPVTNENGTETQATTATVTEATTEEQAATAQSENTTLSPTPETDTPTPTAKTETIEELQKRLDDELARISHKRELAFNREKFLKSMGSLQLYIEELANEKEFETKSGKITFKVLDTDHYDRTSFVENFTISNTDLIRKFCTMLHSEMEQKKTEIEKQLLTA